MTTTMETNAPFDFRHMDLKDVDPNFTKLDGPQVYSLRISSAAFAEYTAKTTNKNQTVGDQVTYIKLALTVVDDPKFTGRKLWEPIFPGDFSAKILKRIEEATGVEQTGDMEGWLAQLSSIQPVIKVQVDLVPDTQRDGSPNPRTVKQDGSADTKNTVNWKAGVSPA